MVSTLVFAGALLQLLCLLNVQASPLVSKRQATTTRLTASQAAVFTPFAFYASAAYCQPEVLRTWNCGTNCNANPNFQPVAAGGNGEEEQFWFVGFDPTLNTVIVSHQGSDFSEIESFVTNGNFFLDDLEPRLFPGVSKSIKTHNGFGNVQALTAESILANVKKAITQFGATKVTVVGHSLGGAISLIDAVYLPLHLPSNVKVEFMGFGMPRVGNKEFANFADQKLGAGLNRINNREDVVPILPGRFLGFRHPSGEKHILDSGEFVACSGQDNTNALCSTGEVKNIFDSSIPDHSGPYGTVTMGC